MADRDYRAGKVEQGALHHLGAGQVEVVGRLVQNHDRGTGEQALGQGHARLLAARQGADLLLQIHLGELQQGEELVDLPALGTVGQADDVDRVGDGVVGVQVGEDLVEVRKLHARPPVHAAGVRRFLQGEQAEQRGLAAAVGADHDDAVAAAQFEGQVEEEDLVVVRLAQTLDAAEGILDPQAVVDPGDDILHGFGIGPLLDIGQPALERLAGVARRFLAIGDGFGFVHEQFFLVLELVLQLLDPGGFFAHVLGEVARVVLELVVLDLDDAVDDPVQKVAVVGNQDQGAAQLVEPLFQPGQPLDVEVVGGLVEQEHVRVLEEDLGQGGAVAPAAGELLHGPGAVGFAEAELGEHGVDAVLVVPAVNLVHALQEGGLASEQAVDGPGVGVGGEGVFDLFQFGVEGVHLGEQGVEDRFDRLVAVEFGELGEVADADIFVHLHLALGGLFLAEDEAQQGGLARAVFADQANAVTFIQAEEGVAKDGFRVVLLGDVVQADQAHAGSSRMIFWKRRWGV